MIDAKAKWIYNVSGSFYRCEDENDKEDEKDDNTYTIPIHIQSKNSGSQYEISLFFVIK